MNERVDVLMDKLRRLKARRRRRRLSYSEQFHRYVIGPPIEVPKLRAQPDY